MQSITQKITGNWLILRLMLLSVLGLLIGAASNALAQNVYWGGVSFSGWEAKDSLYPNVASYLCRAESCADDSIDGWALTAVGNAKFDQFSVSMDYISGGAVEGVIMTPMITGESFAMVEDVTGGQTNFIHVYRVFGSLLFFEFGSGRFISAKPVVVQFTDTLPAAATAEQKRAAFGRLLSSESSGPNVFEQMFNRANSASTTTFSDRYVRVSGVSISPAAGAELVGVQDLDAWKLQVGRFFESYLLEATDAPLVPAASGSEITDEFVATFANASTRIKLPKTVPFEFSVEVRRMLELSTVDRQQKTLCHAVAITLRLEGPMERLLDAPLVRTKESCGVIAAEKQLDKTYYFTQSLFSLLREASANLAEKPNKDFFKRAAPKSKKLDRQFSAAWKAALDNGW
jgi:hypothetical protein